VVAVERAEGVVAFQLDSEVRLYALPDGSRVSTPRLGHLLRRCSDGRISAWLANGSLFQVIDVVTGRLIGAAPREPGIVVGTDSACKVLYTQRIDGTLVEDTLSDEGSAAGRASRRLVVADGYVFDARPSPARGRVGPGTWLALSSGAIARIDEQSGAVRLFGYATPRAEAVADGPRPGQVAYIDGTGVVIQAEGDKTEHVLDASGEIPWEDLSVAPDGTSMLLASPDRIAVLDLTRREITGSMPVDGKTRLSPWDDDGSVIAWSFDRMGGPEGKVIPRGVPLARQIAVAVSNLTAEKGKLTLRR
jgi:hypothetical protein